MLACGGRQAIGRRRRARTPTAPRTLPLARVFVLETSGPPPADTSVTFTTGAPRTIVLYHGGESITFARLSFERRRLRRQRAYRAGRGAAPARNLRAGSHHQPAVRAETRPAVTFEYARYFSAPARARQVYGSDVAFERALAVGQLLPDKQVELLPSTRPAADNLQAALPAPGGYLVAAPQ